MPPKTDSRFLPMTRAEMLARGWDYVDVVFVTGDAYIDHYSFAMAILGRVLQVSEAIWCYCRDAVSSLRDYLPSGLIFDLEYERVNVMTHRADRLLFERL